MNNFYRACYLMVRWHKEQGLKRIEIRDTMFDWGRANNIDMKYNINDIINRVFGVEKYVPLQSPIIKINKQDIENIKRRFDNKKTKLVALAMLCYAKAKANRDGVFGISATSLGAWLEINRKTLTNKYIKELVDFEYLSIISKPENNYKWLKSYDDQSTKYKINASLHNSGDFVLSDNKVRILFSEVFLTV